VGRKYRQGYRCATHDAFVKKTNVRREDACAAQWCTCMTAFKTTGQEIVESKIIMATTSSSTYTIYTWTYMPYMYPFANWSCNRACLLLHLSTIVIHFASEDSIFIRISSVCYNNDMQNK